jgi:hypothetical protein
MKLKTETLSSGPNKKKNLSTRILYTEKISFKKVKAFSGKQKQEIYCKQTCSSRNAESLWAEGTQIKILFPGRMNISENGKCKKKKYIYIYKFFLISLKSI